MSLLSILKRSGSYVSRMITKRRRSKNIDKLLSQGLPTLLTNPTRFLVTGDVNPDVKAVREHIEGRRNQIAAGGTERVEVLYSPKPGSAGPNVTPDLRPEHGKVMSFTMERVALTGKNEKWGVFLHLLANEVGGTFLELGSCAGISGAYLATAPECERLITIEGSEALARLARETTDLLAPDRVEVIAGLFDDVLDTLLPDLGSNALDLAFIDGHHERVATLHYFEKIKPVLRPGAVVVFDDISWSADMRLMWEDVVQQAGVVHAADFGAVGVVFYDPASNVSSYWDFQPITGRHSIGEPSGWKK